MDLFDLVKYFILLRKKLSFFFRINKFHTFTTTTNNNDKTRKKKANFYLFIYIFLYKHANKEFNGKQTNKQNNKHIIITNFFFVVVLERIKMKNFMTFFFS